MVNRAGRKALVHQAAGKFPATFFIEGFKSREGICLEKILSVFVDESGDFGPYEMHSPYYLVTLVFHDQNHDVVAEIETFESRLQNLPHGIHAVHTGPLIRRESAYIQDSLEERRKLFRVLFHFARKLNVQYSCIKIKKRECKDVIDLTSKISKAIADMLRSKETFWNRYDRIIVSYDNGQIELTRILTSVFHALYINVEFRKVKPADYKLFQVADLICTMELLSEAVDAGQFTESEMKFFGNSVQSYVHPDGAYFGGIAGVPEVGLV